MNIAQAEIFSFNYQTANLLFWLNSTREVQNYFAEKLEASKVGFSRAGLDIKMSEVTISYKDFVYTDYEVKVEITSPTCDIGHIYREFQFDPNEVDGALMAELGFNRVDDQSATFRIPSCR